MLTRHQPGLNEVTVLGLDPQVDVDSIHIEGSGPATITDIQTEIVPRRMAFEDIYGEEEESDNSDGSGSPEPQSLAWLRSARASAEENLEKARSNERIATQVLEFLDTYGKNVHPHYMENSKLDDFIERYIVRHEVESERRHQAKVEISNHEQNINSLSKKIEKSEIQRQIAHDKSQRKHALEKSQEMRKRQELRRFWTSSMGQVTIHLDSHFSPTPGSSRRSSASFVAENLGFDSPEGNSADDREITLRLSYVVPGAKWVSRYELSINTPSTTAQLTYGAEFQNQSSETWHDARVTLSTSQTSLSGLRENIPSLQVWHVNLTAAQDDSHEQPEWENIVRSLPEMPQARPNSRAALQDHQMQLMLMEQQNKRRLLMAQQEQLQHPQMAPQAPQDPPAPGASPFSGQPQAAGSLFGRAQMGSSLFGQQQQQQQHQQQPLQQQQLQQQQLQMQQLQRQAPHMSIPPAAPAGVASANTSEDSGDDDDEILPPNLEYQDSVRQEYGLTTTYNLPGRRTLVPSSVNRRHTLAKLDYKSVTLQHVIVPKQRAAAFFRARIRNTSSIQILRGRVGMTVDGTFLGTTNIPRCAPNDIFDISLGVDPSIVVTYAKPTVRHETSGLFVKEGTAIFRRSCWVRNAKSTSANIMVLDQVPISNDEKLQMAILEPKGLVKEGEKVAMAIDAEKGSGVVTMGKDGEVRWMMQLGAGKDVRLVLEYEMKAPRGNHVSVS